MHCSTRAGAPGSVVSFSCLHGLRQRLGPIAGLQCGETDIRELSKLCVVSTAFCMAFHNQHVCSLAWKGWPRPRYTLAPLLLLCLFCGLPCCIFPAALCIAFKWQLKSLRQQGGTQPPFNASWQQSVKNPLHLLLNNCYHTNLQLTLNMIPTSH